MRPGVLLSLAAVFWGLNFHFAKRMLAESNFLETATWRYLLAVGVLALSVLPTWKTLRLPRGQVKGVFLVGLLGLFGFNLTFFLGLTETTALNAALIVSLNPITTAILAALLLGTPLTRHQLLGAGVSIFGVVILLTQGRPFALAEQSLNRGDLLILLANVLFALHSVWVKRYRGPQSTQHFTLLTNAACLLGFLLLLPFVGPTLSLEHTPGYWLAAVGIGVLGTSAAYLLWNAGIARIGATQAGLYMNVVPLAAALAAVVLQAPLAGYHLVSGVVILGGIALARRG